MIDQDTINEDLRNLIAETENVSVVSEAKDFLQKLEQLDKDAFEEIEQVITENIDQSHIFDGAYSDESVRNTFSEINKAFAYGVNEYLETWRNF